MLPRLHDVFERYPKLTLEQREEICRRRIELVIDEIHFDQGNEVDLWYALGYVGGDGPRRISRFL
jgi:hypothetical protein